MNDDLPNSNMRIRVRNTKRFYFYCNIYSFKLLSFLLGEVLNSEIDLDGISKNATSEGYKTIVKGYEKMKNKVIDGDYKSSGIITDIYLKGPRIIFPENITDPINSNCLLISMGEFSLKSNLANRITNKINSKLLKYYDNLFDNYDLNINGFEINVVLNFDGLLNLSKKIKYNIIEKLNFNLIYSQLIEPKNIYNEKFKIGMKINQFTFNISKEFIESIALTKYFYYYLYTFYDKEILEIKKDKTFFKLTDGNKNEFKQKFDEKINEDISYEINKKNEINVIPMKNIEEINLENIEINFKKINNKSDKNLEEEKSNLDKIDFEAKNDLLKSKFF